MLLLICAILPLFGGALASPQADQYMDTILTLGLPGQMRSMNKDPLRIENFSTDFQDKIAIIGKVNGKVNYTDGELTGLSSPQRMSPCGGPVYKFGARVINCTIGFHNLKTAYNGKMKYGKMPVVSVKAKANITTTTLHLEVSAHPPYYQSSLTNFHFVTIGKPDTKFTGLGSPLNKFLKVLQNGYIAHVNAILLNSITQHFKFVLEQLISQHPLPQ